MPSPLADAQIRLQARLRAITAQAVGNAWSRLPAYDEAQVPGFLAAAAPVVLAAQRQSALLTDAYIGRVLQRPPLGLPAADLIGPAVRDGVPADEQWRRPFVTTWTALANGTEWQIAVAAGFARATKMAETDVQLTQRAALQAIQDRDPAIRGYQRVADGGACDYCVMIDGAFVKSAEAMPLHPGCGCGLEPVLTEVQPSAAPAGVAVESHGELGPTLGDPSHVFTSL